VELSALAPEDLAVRRLRLRLPPGTSASSAAGVRGELARSGWPRAPDQTWVLIRQVSVRGARGGLAARAAAAVDERARAATDAGSHGEERAMAVRFRDLADLIARLCADLATGRATGRWYWQRWPKLLRLPAGEAILSLLADQVERLATVSERLAGLGALAAVWGTWTPAQALALHGRLAAHFGTTLLLPAGGDGTGDPVDLPAPPVVLSRRWAPVLAALPRSDPRRRLAAHLVALEWRPLWVAESASARLLDVLADALEQAGSTTPGSRPAAGAAKASFAGIPDGSAGRATPMPEGTGAGLRSPLADRPSVMAGPVAADPRGPGDDSGPHGPDPTRSRPRVAGEPATGLAHDDALGIAGRDQARQPAPSSQPLAGREQAEGGARIDDPTACGHGADPGTDPRARPDEAIRVRPDARVRFEGAHPLPGTGPEERSPAGSRMAEGLGAGTGRQRPEPYLETGEGGLFYLINFLARPEAQALLRAGLSAGGRPSPSAAQGVGWLWLWDLGRRLGLSAGGVLARFLVERLDLAGPAALTDLPELPVGPDLYALGEGLYGAGEVWRPDLLQVPARLRHTPSHLDLDYPLSAVRLPVRRLALDVDPGWVPWLGRVVTFRYVEDWHAARSADGPDDGQWPPGARS
jgi:hypothetical protein